MPCASGKDPNDLPPVSGDWEIDESYDPGTRVLGIIAGGVLGSILALGAWLVLLGIKRAIG